MSSDANREQGIDFGGLQEKLQSLDYPTSVEEVRREYGDHELVLADGTSTLGETLSEVEDETYESADGVLQSVKGAVDEEAVGREGYSDRGGSVESGDAEDDSF